eukprot:1683899-Rhodomonas_salina.4
MRRILVERARGGACGAGGRAGGRGGEREGSAPVLLPPPSPRAQRVSSHPLCSPQPTDSSSPSNSDTPHKCITHNRLSVPSLQKTVLAASWRHTLSQTSSWIVIWLCARLIWGSDRCSGGSLLLLEAHCIQLPSPSLFRPNLAV